MRRRAQPWLGTLVDISIFDEINEAQINTAFHAAFAVLGEIHTLMSFHDPKSEVSRMNRAQVGSVLSLNKHTYTVIAAALQVSAASSGLFDIRVAGLLAQWDYLPRNAPQDDLYFPAIAYEPQQQAWRLLPNYQVQKLRHDWLDLGGIAKGYAVDQAILALTQAGVQAACVNAGGDLRVTGEHTLEIGIRDPSELAAIGKCLQLNNQALATSGIYFSAKVHERRHVSALVHGGTGHAINDMTSVSVRAPQCIWADALTKVVAASGDVQHPALVMFSAEAFILAPVAPAAHFTSQHSLA